MNRVVRAIFVATLALTACAKAASSDAKSAADAPNAPPPPSDVVAVGKGFYLDVPKWTPKDRGENVGLTALYTWGGQSQRSTKATNGGTYWRVIFPDSPAADEVAHLVLRYAFKLTPTDSVKVTGAVEDVFAKVSKAVSAAAQAGAPDSAVFVDKLRVASPDIVAAAKPLADYTDARGEDGASVVLQNLGLKKLDDGTWSVPLAAIAELEALGNERTGSSLLQNRALLAKEQATYKTATTNVAPDACGAAIVGTESDGTKAASALKACADQLAARFELTVKEEEKSASAPRKKQIADVRAVIADLKAAAAAPKVATDLRDVDTALTKITAPIATVFDGWREYEGVLYAHIIIALSDAEKKWVAASGPLSKDLINRVDSLQRDELGATLMLTSGPPGRRYDVATGVTYVGGLQQWVMPIFVSVCPLNGGCLRDLEHIGSPGVPWWRGFSVDLGVRAQILGSTDPRDQKSPGLMAGVSWNPVAFARISAGGYFFENSQSGNKNSVPYFGATINVLEATSVLGVLGLGPPAAPKVVTASGDGKP